MSTEIQYTPEIIERFYAKVSKTPTEQGCLEWLGGCNRGGYGIFCIGKERFLAHRFAWILANGPIPAGLVIRHMCHNSRCTNPAHLQTGTQADNVADMMRSGRHNNAPSTYVHPIRPTESERFYAKVSKTPTETGCLEWTASCSGGGYGKILFGGRVVDAHRVAWILANGPVPDGMWILHSCHNRLCCNPAHLRAGTPSENEQDMTNAGRRGHVTLTEAQVLEIRSEKYADWSLKDIAALFGVSGTNIGSILGRESWRHLDNSADAPSRIRRHRGERRTLPKRKPRPAPKVKVRKGKTRGTAHFKAKFTDEQVLEIRSGKFSDLTQEEIGRHFGVTQATIRFILNRKTWKHLGGSDKSPVQIGNAKGERVSSSKLIAAQVLEIRSEKFAGWTHSKIAKHFGISRANVGAILLRKTWKHI